MPLDIVHESVIVLSVLTPGPGSLLSTLLVALKATCLSQVPLLGSNLLLFLLLFHLLCESCDLCLVVVLHLLQILGECGRRLPNASARGNPGESGVVRPIIHLSSLHGLVRRRHPIVEVVISVYVGD